MTAALKQQAAASALAHIEPGMRLGLGTGSTAEAFVQALGARVAEGLEVVCVPTSESTAELARSLAIPLIDLDETPELDLTVDGADEIDPELRLIKGGGGALLREKIVATASRRMIVVADESKLVATLGQFPLPIEVVPFGLGATWRAIDKTLSDNGLSGPLELRKRNGQPFLTDGAHWIVDARLSRIDDPEKLAADLLAIPGIVEHGLFIDIASVAIIAGGNGTRELAR